MMPSLGPSTLICGARMDRARTVTTVGKPRTIGGKRLGASWHHPTGRDTDRSEYDLADNALEGSVFRMLRQGQRVIFDLDESGQATRLRLGSEVDMGSPEGPPQPAP